MKLLEIVNPSDAYTISGEDLEAAAIAVSVLGWGAYGLCDEKRDLVMPLFMLNNKPTFWFETNFKKSVEGVFEEHAAHPERMLAALDSIVIGSFEDRKVFEETIATLATEAEREAFRKSWHETHRSSENDIGRRAKALAAQMRKREVAKAKP